MLDMTTPESLVLLNKSPTARCEMYFLELLDGDTQEPSKRIQDIVIPQGCPEELSNKTILLKTLHTLAARYKEIKM